LFTWGRWDRLGKEKGEKKKEVWPTKKLKQLEMKPCPFLFGGGEKAVANGSEKLHVSNEEKDAEIFRPLEEGEALEGGSKGAYVAGEKPVVYLLLPKESRPSGWEWSATSITGAGETWIVQGLATAAAHWFCKGSLPTSK